MGNTMKKVCDQWYQKKSSAEFEMGFWKDCKIKLTQGGEGLYPAFYWHLKIYLLTNPTG